MDIALDFDEQDAVERDIASIKQAKTIPVRRLKIIQDGFVDPEYEATDKEIREYAQWLGFVLPEDQELLWIAKAGLLASVPKPWKACRGTEVQDILYFNFKTGENSREHPSDEKYRKLFKREKEKLRPCIVGTLRCSALPSIGSEAMQEVSVTNMGGKEMLRLEGTRSSLEAMPLRQVLRQLKKRIGGETKSKLVLADGKLLEKKDGGSTLGEVLNFGCCLPLAPRTGPYDGIYNKPQSPSLAASMDSPSPADQYECRMPLGPPAGDESSPCTLPPAAAKLPDDAVARSGCVADSASPHGSDAKDSAMQPNAQATSPRHDDISGEWRCGEQLQIKSNFPGDGRPSKPPVLTCAAFFIPLAAAAVYVYLVSTSPSLTGLSEQESPPQDSLSPGYKSEKLTVMITDTQEVAPHAK